jgi:two-component system chemotaxis sensor kinase CheA
VEDLTREFIAESQEGLDRMELCLTELERQPADGELLSEIFRTVHTIKGTTGFLGFQRLGTLAHAGESLLVALRDGKTAVTPEGISGLLALMDCLRRILLLIEATGTEGVQAEEEDALLALLSTLNAGSGELVVKEESTSQNRDVGHPDLLARQDAGQRTLRIDVEVLNRMMNLVGELVLTRNQILMSTPGAENFPELARRLNAVTTELRESVMRARMQAVGSVFGKFPRLVRDLAKACGRSARIEFEGQETGLDKSLLDAIRDPLTHAVRNAIDHGIEAPEERVKAGKPAEGVVRLRAFQQNGSVVVEVSDDGAGISTERVLAKAMERGLVTGEQAASMSRRETLQLLFVAGLSTANEVTDVSGRGVGMDVVRTNVEQVGGSVELESQMGCGTTLRLRVPLTLAIMPALVVESGGQRFAVPQVALIELVYVPEGNATAAVERIGAAEVYRLRDCVLPLIWLDRVLGLDPGAGEARRRFYIAVLESEGRRFGLVVDDLKAPEEIVVKPLSAVLSRIGMFSGATLLGNGTLAMILDVAALGARAGVVPVEETIPVRSEAPPVEHEPIVTESSMVIYEAWRRGSGDSSIPMRMAMPLSVVERIERIPLNTIEYADGRAVWQYDGELVPLEDEDEVLVELRAAPASALEEGAMVTVLICLRPGALAARRVGKVVRGVLDVAAGRLLARDPELCDGQVVMVNNRVTTVQREFAGLPGEAAAEILMEVA